MILCNQLFCVCSRTGSTGKQFAITRAVWYIVHSIESTSYEWCGWGNTNDWHRMFGDIDVICISWLNGVEFWHNHAIPEKMYDFMNCLWLIHLQEKVSHDWYINCIMFGLMLTRNCFLIFVIMSIWPIFSVWLTLSYKYKYMGFLVVIFLPIIINRGVIILNSILNSKCLCHLEQIWSEIQIEGLKIVVLLKAPALLLLHTFLK